MHVPPTTTSHLPPPLESMRTCMRPLLPPSGSMRACMPPLPPLSGSIRACMPPLHAPPPPPPRLLLLSCTPWDAAWQPAVQDDEKQPLRTTLQQQELLGGPQ
mmetsp:Transcript_41129/g.122794  ORF Transcript_41129/g.122794 Transcript_41129/m.122794 type:complete len:102 (-) Transcript_41129:272-577(-)